MKIKIFALLFALLILLPLTACSKEDYSEKAEQKLLELCNEARQEANSGQLSINAGLSENARVRAEEIASTGELSHVRPDGRGCFTAVTQDYIYVGENLAKGNDPEEIFKAWMNSPEHRKNIENGNYTQTGFGCAQKDGAYYWVELFMGTQQNEK